MEKMKTIGTGYGTFLFFLIYVSNLFLSQGKAMAQDAALASLDFQWMQKVLDNWERSCSKDLHIGIEPLPWIIFYDSVAAWHVGAEEKALPKHMTEKETLKFNKKNYAIYKVDHSKDGIWVPGRNAIAISDMALATMPYGNGKTFFIASLPTLFHKLAPEDQRIFLDVLFMGTNIHELVHTRQLGHVLPQLEALQKEHNLPESLSEEYLATNYSQNKDYTKIFFEEKARYMKAAVSPNLDTCLLELSKALKLTEKRHKTFFTGLNAGLAELDEIFLSLEGSAMWAQFHTLLHEPVSGPTSDQLLAWLVERTRTWTQEQGLALFLLIDRFVSGWSTKYFGQKMPSPFEELRRVVER